MPKWYGLQGLIIIISMPQSNRCVPWRACVSARAGSTQAATAGGCRHGRVACILHIAQHCLTQFQHVPRRPVKQRIDEYLRSENCPLLPEVLVHT
jgi:hypothetical protein